MIYPKFIKKGDTIGITAPSLGIINEKKLFRLDNAHVQLEKIGYKIKETDNVRTRVNGRSSSIKDRVEQLENLYLDPDVSLIICATGGEYLLEILLHLNYDIISKNIKWIQGYSDPTSLLFIITTNYDIATIYGNTIGSYGMEDWHQSIKESIEILEGNVLIQKSFDKYEDEVIPYEIGNEPYNLTTNVKWKSLSNKDSFEMEGRMIGGCVDTLLNLIGTPFDKTKEFIEKYKDEGFVWYFDNAELSSENIYRALWQLKQNGWFNYAKGIIFGRSGVNSSYYDISFEDSVKTALYDLNIPIIIDADIGHKPPRMTIINGAYVKVKSVNGKGSIEFILK